MIPMVLRYPLDPTGTSPDNFVAGEPHKLTANRRYRIFPVDYGAFYTESVVMRDMATGQELQKGVQYFPAELYEQPTDQYGKEICAVIVVVDPTVSNDVEIDYQCLGGPYSTPATAIVQMLEKLDLDNRPVKWGDLIGKPDRYSPTPHYHDAGDIYGFEYLVHVLDRIRQAILMGDAASHDVIYQYIDTLDVTLRNVIAGVVATLNEHIGNSGNPHNTTAHQTGAYTTQEVDALITQLTNSMNQHARDTGNPHNTSAHQTGAYTMKEVDTMIALIYDSIGAGLNAHLLDNKNPHGTTAEQVGAYTKAVTDALIKAVSDALALHAADQTNSHHVTADQVNLGKVNNFATATPAQVVQGGAVDLFVTPAGVAAMRADHASSGDHDSRYIRNNAAVESGIKSENGKGYMFISGAWRQVWPPAYQ